MDMKKLGKGVVKALGYAALLGFVGYVTGGVGHQFISQITASIGGGVGGLAGLLLGLADTLEDKE